MLEGGQQFLIKFVSPKNSDEVLLLLQSLQVSVTNVASVRWKPETQTLITLSGSIRKPQLNVEK